MLFLTFLPRNEIFSDIVLLKIKNALPKQSVLKSSYTVCNLRFSEPSRLTRMESSG